MYPGYWAKVAPDRPAVVAATTGSVITYRELDDRSIRLARLLRASGLRPGDHMAIFLENHVRYLEVVWAALRSGLYLTTVNSHSTVDEAGYIVDNCDARALISSVALGKTAAAIPALASNCGVCLMIGGGAAGGFDDYEAALSAHAAGPLADEPRGEFMLYSSGTTGKPKGILRPISESPISDGLPLNEMFHTLWQFDQSSIYLSPAPMYHSAPVASCATVQSLGGTVVMMESFDPRQALAAIERFSVTHSQWVPTMFVRMLKLPERSRTEFDLSSHRVAIHAAAPCPRQVKEAMLQWWGPIIHEYYGGTEFNGTTYVNSQDWLRHPGTVGRPIRGSVHICDETGDELPVGESGLIYFESARKPFEYYKAPEQTGVARHPRQPSWTTLFDVGRVDEDGFLYLTDRATFMIVSGGVNIYPQEIEDCLIMNPEVADVAVFGVPNDEFGEEVKAVVQPADGVTGGSRLEHDLIEYCRHRLSHFKCPRSIDFATELPREPTGKLYKRRIREHYWAGRETRIG
jgi:acyl-CoA synthetase (AMP-forming)/AMP-acid ligase II